MSGWVKNTVGTRNINAYIFWYANTTDGNGSYVGVAAGTAATDPTTWTRVSMTAVAPANAYFISPGFNVTNTGSISDTFRLDGVLVEESSEVGTYFDGEVFSIPSGYGRMSNEWDGTAHQSSSTLTYYISSVGPEYSVSAERMYRRLPEAYRTLDSQYDWHFKKYVSSMADQLNEIDTLVARLEYVSDDKWATRVMTQTPYNTYVRPDGIEDVAFGWEDIGRTSDLLDGRTADFEWLPYIGQIVGADILALETEAERRDAVIYNYLGFLAGSTTALSYAALSALTGEKYIRVYPHRDGEGGSTTHVGTQWDILIITKSSETPGGAQSIVDAINSKGAKPAGVVLHCITYSLIWSSLESTFSTWTMIEATGSWGNLESSNADDLPI
jgi:hypothetical protein